MNKPRKSRDNKKTQKPSAPELIRLNKFIANAGVCSRREADNLIQKGEITVNGTIVTELGAKVKSSDKIKYQGKLLRSEKLQYVLLNKPKDFITTLDDPQGRKTVMTLVSKACRERIYPVGRLDRATTGLLLFTNDGDLAKKLTHPSHLFKKIYQVNLDKPLTNNHFEEILEGLNLDDGKAVVDELAILDEERLNIGVQLHIGRNRIVRRIFEHLGYKVTKLDRVMLGSLTKRDLPRGKWRHLNQMEIRNLKNDVRKAP